MPLKESGLLIETVTETLKHKINRQKGVFLVAMIARMVALLIPSMTFSLIQSVNSSFINVISGKWGGGRFLPLLAFSLMIKVLEKVLTAD